MRTPAAWCENVVIAEGGPVNHVALGYDWDIWSLTWLMRTRCIKRPTKATWAAGRGAAVRSVAYKKEFNDPGWAPRGQYRALKQFIMNWNN